MPRSLHLAFLLIPPLMLQSSLVQAQAEAPGSAPAPVPAPAPAPAPTPSPAAPSPPPLTPETPPPEPAPVSPFQWSGVHGFELEVRGLAQFGGGDSPITAPTLWGAYGNAAG